MKKSSRQRGYSLMEVMVAISILLIGMILIVPRGSTTKDNATTSTTAEELVARFRQARQIAITKAVPVGVAFPRTPSIYHTNQGYFLEGEVNPRVTEQWQIQQSKQEVAYFTGTWSGPNWAPAPVLRTASQAFDPAKWFGPVTPPDATIFIFTPSGNVVSQAQAADGKYRVVVGMGVSSGGSSTLVSINTPYTVWVSPSGEVGLDKGVYGGNVVASVSKDSSPVATYTAPQVAVNSDPIVQAIAPASAPGAKAYPNTVNPKTRNGNVIDLDAVLTLEVRVKDNDGDPPYFQWETVEAAIADANGTTFHNQSDMDVWGGRFGNADEVRMEWDAETQEWVGRDTWAPATGDEGGNRYKLVCNVRDRKGGTVTTGFPVDGNYLVTTKEPWVLYKTWNAANRAELWKMTLDGLEHTRVVSFGYQDVDFGQWSPSGAEIIVGAADGVYRVSADGGNLSRMASVSLGGPVDGCCLSPAGDALYYIGGPKWGKSVRKVYFDRGKGQLEDVQLGGAASGLESTLDLSAAQYGDKVILMSSFHWNNTSSLFGTGLFKKKKRRGGALVIDAGTGTSNLPPEPKANLLSGLVGTQSGTKSPWRGHGRGDRDKTTSYGPSLNLTNDSTALANIHVLYGSGDGNIHAVKTDIDPTHLIVPLSNSVPGYPRATGINDVHHPKYANDQRDSLIFVAGRGTAARLYYWPNLNDRNTIRQLPLSPLNNGAEQPSVSRPR